VPEHAVSGAAAADVELHERHYAALRAGDRDALAACQDPGFTGVVCEGMPAGAGRHEGADAAIDEGWWAIGAAVAVTARRDEYVGCADGRVLVRGRYVGRSRDGAHDVDAVFTHLWTLRDGRALAIEQVTDTARWSLPRT
jgi:2-(1,2-epoxy-1,2-dihydrophenyl)acetyl-CoA isomerase